MAHFTAEACWALADKAADLVQAFTLVQTGGAETLIHLNLTVSPLKSGHADAGVVPNAIQTCAIILAGVRSTLVDILFTAWPRITPNTVTGEGAVRVHTLTSMLARVGTNAAFVSVDVAGAAYISRWTVTVEHATNGVGVTLRALSTGVTDTGVISMAEQTCLSVGAKTDKRRNTVDARGAWAACSCSTIIDVFRAVGSTPAVNAHTDIAANQVAAGPSILASVWLQTTLVHIFCTALTCPLWRALAVVGVDAIHTGSSIGTLMTGTVINVVLTVSPVEAWKAVARVAGFRALVAGASI